MTVILGSNISSLRAQRQLTDTQNELSSIFSRLSSGQRINRASDDAAGLAISDELSASSRVYAQGIRNFNDGISLLTIADSTLDSLIQITTRLEELAVQASSGILGTKQREAVDQEAQALKQEFSRISLSTRFNGQSLFNGDLEQLQLQGGFGADAILNLGVGGAIGTGEYEAANSVALAGFNTNRGLVSVDINNDGKQDLVGVADGANAVLSLGYGDGSGNFNSFSTVNVSSNFVEEMQYGDVNSDGMMDLILLGRDVGANDLPMVLLNQGNGTFGSAIEGVLNTTATFSATGLDVGDINGDGFLDIVTTGGNGAGSAGTADVMLGDGSGNFSSLSTFTTNSGNSINLTLGDINNDGNLDLVTVGNTLGFQAEANVQLGDGTGSFGASTKYLLGSAAKLDVKLADINNDGNLDFVSGGGSHVTVMIGDGTGAFSNLATTTAASGLNAWEVEVADINGDGLKDVVTSGTSTVVLLGDGAGNFESQPELTMEDNGSSQLAIGDFNQDGVYDLATMGIDLGGTSYITTRVASTTDGVAPLLDFSLSTMADARQALMMFKTKRELLSSQRGEIGSGLSRLDVAIEVLAAIKENFKVAEGRIRDADIAQETSSLVRNGILQRAASSVLVQANQQPSLALALLS